MYTTIYDQYSHHIETSLILCSQCQLTGFPTNGTFSINRQNKEDLLKVNSKEITSMLLTSSYLILNREFKYEYIYVQVFA